MTGHQSLTTEQALQLHKKFLQDLLQDVVKVLETGQAGANRAIEALKIYWEANLQHSAARRTVQDALVRTSNEKDAERMGRPFLLILRAELQAGNVQNLDAISQEVYDEAHEISLAEAASGERDLARREKLIARIKAASS